MQCLRTEGPFNTLQMQDSQSVVLRGTRLWNKPEDLSLLNPCSSQNAMKTEHSPRSVSDHPRLFPSRFKSFTLHLSLSTSLMCTVLFGSSRSFLHRQKCPTPSCVLPPPSVSPLQVQCHTLTAYCWCVTSDGKPVSGSSVHNRTPVCSGTKQGGEGEAA